MTNSQKLYEARAKTSQALAEVTIAIPKTLPAVIRERLKHRLGTAEAMLALLRDAIEEEIMKEAKGE